ncbi:MAG: DUF2157 domain-containing protein [Planctomycetes bacterium]|nr:DUF2157 domain-containing protein [Planctomycetota bacterium]
MDLFDLGGRAFRARLRAELPRWREEGLLDERAAALLAERYRLNESGWRTSVAAIYILGVLLVGGGVISFVAWNWEALPAWAKLALIGSAMVAAHLAGHWLWRVKGTSPRLGHALTFLGTLIFGANIGLVAQIFHLHSNAMNGVGAWAAGAALAGWALRSVPNALLGLGLGTIWACNFIDQNEGVLPFTPVLLAAVFLPLARLERSRLLLSASYLAIAITATVHAGEEAGEGAAIFASLLAPAALFLSLPSALPPESEGARLATPGARLGFAGWLVVVYVASFRGLADETGFGELAPGTWGWAAIAAPALLGAIVSTAAAFRRGDQAWSDPWSPFLPVGGTILLLLLMAIPGSGVVVTVAANAILAAFSILLLASAVRSLERGPFWLGVVLAGVLVQTRFFEYETGLLLKAIVFVACGIAVLTVGLAFERRVREAAHA